jgi:phosphohistidine phosphatase
MKTLVLVRHGHAQQTADDATRPLSPEGRAAVRKRAPQLIATPPDRVLCSPAVRTRQTAEVLLQTLSRDVPVLLPDALYLAEVGRLLELIRNTPAEVETLWIVGHNPGLSDLGTLLLRESVALDTADVVALSVSGWQSLEAAPFARKRLTTAL